ncbi:tRNA-uridine aminocarboxypropyltransferase [Undibacterium sp. RuTC16W]|uniref:tRNA-uridine aminocarboxypropyltransferase n=1 Tax=Undibacterium sp. RuTC16W TaxID=3413048 RepID=UPI003BF3F28E
MQNHTADPADPVAPPVMTRRPGCERCLRPQSACICPWVNCISSEVEVVILQHPFEVQHAKGSARLLHLCLQGSQLHVGEVFDENWLRTILQAGDRHNVLLYPETPQGASPGMQPATLLDPAILEQPHLLRLIVLDGTWRKSRKMLYQNRLLQALPRVTLCDTGESHYRIRKAHKPDQLSTLEATCYALMQLEKSHESEQRSVILLTVFEQFIAQQEAMQAMYQKGCM